MTTIPEIPKYLREAWCKVETDYTNGLINSERCLQAALYHALREELNEKDFVILVEPHIEIGGQSTKPDIVIRDSKDGGAIQCILELKLVPYEKVTQHRLHEDLRKLDQYSKLDSLIPLDTFRLSREFNMRTKSFPNEKDTYKFQVTNETLYVLAVITLGQPLVYVNDNMPSNFLLLAGEMKLKNPGNPADGYMTDFSIKPLRECLKRE